jgi:hypothetical protein
LLAERVPTAGRHRQIMLSKSEALALVVLLALVLGASIYFAFFT